MPKLGQWQSMAAVLDRRGIKETERQRRRQIAFEFRRAQPSGLLHLAFTCHTRMHQQKLPSEDPELLPQQTEFLQLQAITLSVLKHPWCQNLCASKARSEQQSVWVAALRSDYLAALLLLHLAPLAVWMVASLSSASISSSCFPPSLF